MPPGTSVARRRRSPGRARRAAWRSTAWIVRPSRLGVVGGSNAVIAGRAGRRPARARCRVASRGRRCRAADRGAACRGRGPARASPGRSVRYRRSGTSVRPFDFVLPRSSSISRPVEEQLAGPLRLVVVAVRLLERRDVGADQPGLVALDPRVGVGQVDLAGPDRLDLGPGQDDPRLERVLDAELVARPSVEGDRRSRPRELAPCRDAAMGPTDAIVRGDAANAGPIRTGVSIAYPPTGVVRLDGHLLRGGAATVLSITAHHLLSFAINRTGCATPRASTEDASLRPPSERQRRLAEELDRLVPDRGPRPDRRSPGSVDGDVRHDPDLVDPALVRRQPLGDRQLRARRSSGELDPLLDRALAERRLADERRPLAVLEGAGDDLARRCAAPVDEHDEPDVLAGRRDRRRRRRLPPGCRRRPPARTSAPADELADAIRRAAVT